MKKIYFAGSIRGGRDDAALYQRIIRHIAGTDKVLTEHIGSTDIEADEKDMTDSDIYGHSQYWRKNGIFPFFSNRICGLWIFFSTFAA